MYRLDETLTHHKVFSFWKMHKKLVDIIFLGLFWYFCVQVEDIVDSGSTLACLIAHMESKGASSVSVCTFLDKPTRRKVHFEMLGNGKFYSGFQVRSHLLHLNLHFKFVWQISPFFLFLTRKMIMGTILPNSTL